MGQTSYEVQVMQGDRWRIHAQFPSSGRGEAIEEAKTLESLPGIAGIKVMRDVYDDQSGLHKASVIHKHTPKPGKAGTGGNKYAKYQNRAAANRMSDLDDPFGGDDEDDDNRRKASSGLGVIVKMLMVLLFSIALTAVVTSLISAFLPTRFGDIRLVGNLRANIIVGTAIVCFLVTVSTSFMAFMGRDELDVPELKRRKRKAARQKQKVAKMKADKAARAIKDKKLEEDDEARAKAEMARIKREKEKLEKEQEEQAPEEEAPQEDDKPADDGEDGFSRLSPAAEQHKASLMTFFGEAVRNLPAERKKMDNYNRFGLNLYLAGATEALGGEKNLDGQTVEAILSDALQTMGLKEEHAEAFSKRYEDYLLQDARYMEIFQSGRRSISDFMKGKKEATKELEVSLNDWNKPKAAEDPEREVVVMFTDIVGSTAMTHEKGNLAAQEVVRAHNRVVRDALSKTGGKEIKHTGDGIMASFENVTSSLLATQQMQMMIHMHNEQGPKLPLKVKIGINAGRVVMEEQDLYGVTVQMAARIVDKASADQIFISDTVYGMAQGGQWKFVKRGPYYMKGIAGPVFLQEVVWDDKADITAMNAQSVAERPKLEVTYAQASGQPMPTPDPAGAVAEPVAGAEPEAKPAETVPVEAKPRETGTAAGAPSPNLQAQQAIQPQQPPQTQVAATKAYAQTPSTSNSQTKPVQDV